MQLKKTAPTWGLGIKESFRSLAAGEEIKIAAFRRALKKGNVESGSLQNGPSG